MRTRHRIASDGYLETGHTGPLIPTFGYGRGQILGPTLFLDATERLRFHDSTERIALREASERLRFTVA